LSSVKKNLWHWLSTKPGLLLALLLNVLQSWTTYRLFGIDVSAMAYLMGSFTVFIFLVDNRDDRFLKGFFLIAYGMMIQFSYDLVFKKALEGSPWADNVKMLLMMITIGSTGAGGSLIATHSDRSSTDLESGTNQANGESAFTRLDTLERQVQGLDRKLDQLIKRAGLASAGLLFVGLRLVILLLAR
jgi:hypothetical protein